MKILLWSIGKEHEPYIRTGTDDFTRRIARYYPVEWKLIAPPRNAASLSVTDLKKKESEIILNGLTKEDWLIALDERGKQMSSEGLAQLLQTRANESARQLVFLIGGVYGFDDAVLKRADHRWSLSLLTFPHQLVRLILAEQLYRACTILRNEKYHHP
ncbi:MAG TPA: 23S rRNA (pseudouridine(1915)-N(3))-methyltransferase RlmH [Puia sp.]|nr:23S rRNA (pseudouridine(1915)-N(3))-methyltransferase RlmH [Puia sp.]